MNEKIKKLILNCTIITLIICLFSGCGISKTADKDVNNANNEITAVTSDVNYADKENWAYCGIGENKDA
ncbi:MAG TPA: hypothetical protein DG753_10450, partial [Clostridium sp.]|nr:hypothetical protein [Clostridium sp.]